MKRHKVSKKEAEAAVLENLKATKAIREQLGLTEEGGRAKDTDFLGKLDNLFGPPPEKKKPGTEKKKPGTEKEEE